MGQALAASSPAAREVIEEVDDALGQKLGALMADGPEATLTLTENAQPAIFAVSMAVVRHLEREAGIKMADYAIYLAGHSLGEYTALAAAGSITIADGARVLRRRGRAMQRAVPAGKGGMAALIGADREMAYAIAGEAAEAIGAGAVCVVANDNADGQLVISGHQSAIDKALVLAKERGIKRAVPLTVSAPFHSPLMEPAADEMRDVLAETAMAAPVLPIVTNVTAEAESDPERLRDLLIEQVTAPVRWRESVLWMRDKGVETLVELGGSKVLSGLTRRIDRTLSALSVQVPEDVDALAEALGS